MFCTSAGNSGSVMSMRNYMPSIAEVNVRGGDPGTSLCAPVPGSLSSLLHLHNRQRQPMPASMPGTLPNPTMPGSSAVLMPMERQMAMNSNIMGMQGPNLNNPCVSPQVPPMHSEAKLRLKAALSHHPAGMSNGNMNTMGHMMDMMTSRQEQTAHHHMHTHPHQHQTLPPHHPYHQHQPHHPHPQPHHQQNHPHHHAHSQLHAHPSHHQTSPHPPMHTGGQAQLSPAAQQMQPTQTIQPPQPAGGRRRRVVDEDPDERRRKFLERNRAAATRCRQKRKVWVMSLEKKAEELTQTNMQLQNEVSMLKNEVAQLKQLLLTHKDCPITAMQKESQGYLSPESSPPGSPVPACSQQQVIQHNTITTSSSVSEVVGNSSLSQLASHRTDMNPIL
ncbi:cyclic AMP-responsive element-binding protein 5 isoform X5 [Rhinatrema bivittatum]|uniref:cyclic AMP-responsive element-binding protein 5 isoform X5 n=1 Tax=Rhinatrema bivittatum TaxID=194408 RepID=UPI00112B6871|nr:cyclic AMP-responsive element-binding protein 5 isoform X5 [Rhinatrema bivittatum]